MQTAVRRSVAGMALALAGVLALAGCGGQEEVVETTVTTPAPVESPAATPEAAEPEAATGNVIEVVVQGGAVEGGVRTEDVALGEEATIRVTSDVADEVHLHGPYDAKVDVEAGGTAELPFTADVPGVFEVELEERSQLLLNVRVS